ncbi:MAG: Uma2 family endonuclease [Ruminococcus sp.]|nr:Uma2 family endonuclease [Ruminococcus sp.]
MALPEEMYYTADDFFELTGEDHCELIDGFIVDMSSPGSLHQDLIRGLIIDISLFINSHKGKCKPYLNLDVKLDDRTVLEPDILVTCDKSKVDNRKHCGAPDWIIEVVSHSNYTNDYYIKYNLYKEYGVKEYWIIDPRKVKRTVTVFIWENGQETKNQYTFDDKIPVHIFRDKTPPLEIRIADYIEEE